MEIGDLSGWIAAFVAVLAMSVAIWNASSAESQAKAANTQAREAERASQAAVQTLELMKTQYSEAKGQREIADKAEAYKTVLVISKSLFSQARTFRRLAEQISSDIDPQAAMQLLDASSAGALNTAEALGLLFPIMNRIPFGDELVDAMAGLSVIAAEINADRKQDTEPVETLLKLSDVSHGAAMKIQALAAEWAGRQEW